MVIVKLTILALVISAVGIFCFRNSVKAHPERYVKMQTTEKYPTWMVLLGLLILFDIAGIVASTVYLLFFR